MTSILSLSIIILVNGCALNNIIKEDKNNFASLTINKISETIKNDEQQLISKANIDNFNLHVFTEKRNDIIPCYYWTFLEKVKKN